MSRIAARFAELRALGRAGAMRVTVGTASETRRFTDALGELIET